MCTACLWWWGVGEIRPLIAIVQTRYPPPHVPPPNIPCPFYSLPICTLISCFPFSSTSILHLTSHLFCTVLFFISHSLTPVIFMSHPTCIIAIFFTHTCFSCGPMLFTYCYYCYSHTDFNHTAIINILLYIRIIIQLYSFECIINNQSKSLFRTSGVRSVRWCC